jgi:hypothetical protein
VALAGVQAEGRLGALGGGLALGAIALTRPYDAALLGLPLGAWAISRRRPLFLVGAAVGGALVLVDNAALTGSPTTFPINVWFDRGQTELAEALAVGCNHLGFGADRGCHGVLGFGASDALANLLLNLRYADRLFLGFRGSLLLAALGLPLLFRRAPALAAVGLLVPLGYALYWYPGVCDGARFWSLAALAFAPAVALVAEAAASRLRRSPWMLLLPLAVPMTWTLAEAQDELADRYWCADPALRDVVDAEAVDRGVILVDDQGEYRARLSLTAPPGLVCTAATAMAGIVGLDGAGHEARTWITAAGDPETVARGVLRRTPGVDVYLLRRDLPTGATTLKRWDGARFGP